MLTDKTLHYSIVKVNPIALLIFLKVEKIPAKNVVCDPFSFSHITEKNKVCMNNLHMG